VESDPDEDEDENEEKEDGTPQSKRRRSTTETANLGQRLLSKEASSSSKYQSIANHLVSGIA